MAARSLCISEQFSKPGVYLVLAILRKAMEAMAVCLNSESVSRKRMWLRDLKIGAWQISFTCWTIDDRGVDGK